jgi:hypothetical protein
MMDNSKPFMWRHMRKKQKIGRATEVAEPEPYSGNDEDWNEAK